MRLCRPAADTSQRKWLVGATPEDALARAVNSNSVETPATAREHAQGLQFVREEMAGHASCATLAAGFTSRPLAPLSIIGCLRLPDSSPASHGLPAPSLTGRLASPALPSLDAHAQVLVVTCIVQYWQPIARGSPSTHLPPPAAVAATRACRAAAAARAGLLPGRLWPNPAAALRMQHTQPQQPQRHAAAAAAGAAAGGSQPEQQAAEPPPKPRQRFSFCRMCGGGLELVLPEGDGSWRHVCSKCGYTDYENPRMVVRRAAVGWVGPCLLLPAPVRMAGCSAALHAPAAAAAAAGGCRLVGGPRCAPPPPSSARQVGCIVEHEGRILLCRRGIEPQRGLWTVPAGRCRPLPPPLLGGQHAQLWATACLFMRPLPTRSSATACRVHGVRRVVGGGCGARDVGGGGRARGRAGALLPLRHPRHRAGL